MSLNNNIFKPILLPHEGHIYLDAEDECYYFGEYTPRKGYAHSHINDDIYNLKKIPTRRSNPKEWKHKENTIRKVAHVLQSLIKKDSEITLIPIPPSKEKSDPLYDDRLLQILKITCSNWKNPDIRELIY